MSDSNTVVDIKPSVASIFGRFAVTDNDTKGVKDAEFIVPNLIVRGQVTVFVAEPNCGKTAILVALAPQIVEKGYQLTYFNFDAGAAEIARHHTLAKRDGYMLVAPDIKIGTSIADVLIGLEQVANEPDLSNQVFVIDTLKKCTDVINKPAAKKFYETLRSISGKGGTVILAGHANKHRDKTNGKLIYEGTGDLRADVDNMLFMEYHKGSSVQTITCYPDKTRTVFKMVSFSMNLHSRVVTIMDEVVDVRQGAIAIKKAQRNDPDGEIKEAIIKAVSKGKTVQAELIKHCRKKGYPVAKSRNTLISGADSKNPLRFLSVANGANNSKVYGLLDR